MYIITRVGIDRLADTHTSIYMHTLTMYIVTLCACVPSVKSASHKYKLQYSISIIILVFFCHLALCSKLKEDQKAPG